MPLTHSTVPELFSDIADAIRAKGGTVNPIVADTFPDAIASLPTGGGGGVTINNQNKIVTPTKSTQVITKDNSSYTGLGTVTVNPIPDQYVDTSSTTATASMVHSGDVFYNSSGVLTTGTALLQMGVIRPDAELIQTISYDKFWVGDNNLTIPSYTTATTTVQATQNLTPAISMNTDNYNYYVLERALTIPQYNTTAVAKAREE